MNAQNNILYHVLFSQILRVIIDSIVGIFYNCDIDRFDFFNAQDKYTDLFLDSNIKVFSEQVLTLNDKSNL